MMKSILKVFILILGGFLMTGCGESSKDTTAPTVNLTAPAKNAIGVATNKAITTTFAKSMDPSTITTATYTLTQGTTAVPGTVTYSDKTAIFTPTAKLADITTYTATVTTGAKDLAGNALAVNSTQTFTTGIAVAAGPQPVNLGTAGSFVILAKTGITTTGTTVVVGDMGVSPIAATAMTGFGLIMDASNEFSTSSLVTGKIYASDYAVPTPAKMTTAVSDMETAYTDAAGRVLPDSTELGAGNIDGMTIVPGLYKWSTGVLIPIGVTLSGGADDVWIFQIAQNLDVANGAIVTLSGGAQAKNIFWQVAGQATFGTTSNFKGIVLCQTAIVMQTGTIISGRALAQTAVTLDAVAMGVTDITAPIAPTVIATVNVNGATGVALDAKAGATFSEAMDPSTITIATFTLKQGATAVSGTVAYSGVNAVFTPTSVLAASTLYTATITTGAKNLAGIALAANYTWSFTTGLAPDTTAPTVTLTAPVDAATGVASNTIVGATLSEVMDPLTITTATFTVKQGATAVLGAVTYSGVNAVFTPASNLAASAIYTATITIGAKDLAGNALASDYVWSFTTDATAAAGRQPVNLGTAGSFVILAKTGITTTGTTAVVGDMGVSPIAATAMTGFGLIMDSTNTFSTSSLVTGQIFAADYAPSTPSKMTTAVSDMEIAYTDAAGRVLPDSTELGAGNIDGMTLVPGLYKWSSGVGIPTGVTLSGGANDVWIFQIAQNLDVANGAIVTLGGGAQAKNIFWQVAGQTTLGTTSNFKGIILCKTAIVMQTGTIVNGRALAQTAVTLDATAITNP